MVAVSLVIFFAASLMVDWHSWAFPRPPRPPGPAGPKTPTERAEAALASAQTGPTNAPASRFSKESVAFLQKEYENAVKEIHKRLEQESLLFVLKFSLVGAVLGLFFAKGKDDKGDKADKADNARIRRIRKSPAAALFFWVAVITSGIVDTRILFHVDVIVTLGEWIRFHVEPVLLPSSITGWETFIPTSGFFGSTSVVYPLLRLNVLLLTLLLFMVGVCMYFWKSKSEVAKGEEERVASEISLGGAFVAFGVFFLSGIHYHYDDSRWLWACLICLILGWLSLLWVWWLDQPKVGSSASGEAQSGAAGGSV